MGDIKTDILLYVEDSLSDGDLYFNSEFIPDLLEKRLNTSSLVTSVYFSVPAMYEGGLKSRANAHVREGIDGIEFWKNIFSKTGSDHIIKIYADSPFIDISVIEEMIKIHTDYLAEFTFSENLPEGLGCEIVSRELVEALPDLDQKSLPIGKVVRGNINQFDVELYYKDPDLRPFRVGFRASRARDRKVMENIHKISGSYPGHETIGKIIDENPAVLYNGPSYLEIELTGRCDLDCIFCYRKNLKSEHGVMETEILEKALSGMREFGLPYSVCLGGSGEPMMHPNFYKHLELILNEGLVERIIVETNGLLAGANYRSFLKSSAPNRIITIVNFNALDSATYSSNHGADHYEAVMKNILEMNEAEATAGSLYVQIMKINETKAILDRYYDMMEKHKVKIILQKQNTYLGRITDRRYSDLSPIERIPCWHLQRDMYILSDGTVAFCKQDVDGESSRGDLKSQSISEIWKSGESDFISDTRKKYPAKPDCTSCDEWYTFNY